MDSHGLKVVQDSVHPQYLQGNHLAGGNVEAKSCTRVKLWETTRSVGLRNQDS